MCQDSDSSLAILEVSMAKEYNRILVSLLSVLYRTSKKFDEILHEIEKRILETKDQSEKERLLLLKEEIIRIDADSLIKRLLVDQGTTLLSKNE